MRSGAEGDRDEEVERPGGGGRRAAGGPEPGSPVWSNLFLRLCLRGGELVWRLPRLGDKERAAAASGGIDPARTGGSRD